MDQIFAFTGLAEADVDRAVEHLTWLNNVAATNPGTHAFWGGTRYLNKTGCYLDVQTEEDKDRLWEIIAAFYQWGRPLPLCELLPKESKFHLFLDIEIACPDQQGVANADKYVEEGPLLKSILPQIHLFFNEYPRIDAAMFRSSGVGTDGFAKSTHRLHFPQIVVDKEGLWNVMLMLVHNLEKMTWEDDAELFDPQIKRLKELLRELDEQNSFRNIISQNGIVSKWGVRMALCDKLSEKPYSQPIDRPLGAVSLERYEVNGNPEYQTFPKDDLQSFQWVKMSQICCDASEELTPFNPLRIVRSTRLLRTGPGGSTQDPYKAAPPPPTNPGSRKTIQMRSNGVTAEQTQREVLTSFGIEGNVLQGPQDNVSVTFLGDKIEVNGKQANVRVVQSLLESIGAEPIA